MRAQRAGFSLLEVMVSLAIVSVVAVSALVLVASEARVAEKARAHVTAAALAEYQIAELELLPATTLQSMVRSPRLHSFAKPFDSYRWNISPAATGVVDNSDVELSIEWTDGRISVPLTGPGFDAISRAGP